ncbi:MAG: glycosyltransferase [Propionibacteriales bacterium]|nr:glycosyltransferase [Propionibacteriales bacterium]
MSGPLRVLQIIDSLGVSGGAEQSVATLAPHLVKQGLDVHVAYLVERGGLRYEIESHGIPVHSLATGGQGRAAWFRQARELIGDTRPDVVHTTLFESDLAGRCAAASRRVPCVSSLVTTAYGPVESGEPGVRRLKMRGAHAADALTARLVARFHAVTRHVATVMGRRLGVPRSRIEVVPRGRDAQILGRWSAERRAAARATLGLADDGWMVLSVGRHEPQKGQDALLRALPSVVAQVPGARVVVAGREGRATPGMRELVRTLGIGERVTFLGMREDVPDLLTAADAFAFPSLWEGAGGTLLEAMALECPIVSSRLPTLLETVDDSTAVLVPAGDPAALAAGLLATYRHPQAARDRAARARDRFVDSFTVESSAERMAHLFRSVASAGRADRGR